MNVHTLFFCYFLESNKKIKCGRSRGFSQLIKVRECQDTITSHPETCYPLMSELSEVELILSKDGNQVEQMVICFPRRTSHTKVTWVFVVCRFGLTLIVWDGK